MGEHHHRDPIHQDDHYGLHQTICQEEGATNEDNSLEEKQIQHYLLKSELILLSWEIDEHGEHHEQIHSKDSTCDVEGVLILVDALVWCKDHNEGSDGEHQKALNEQKSALDERLIVEASDAPLCFLSNIANHQTSGNARRKNLEANP